METKYMNKPHQRVGSISNAHVGKDFEAVAVDVFAAKGIHLESELKLPVGVAENKKLHAFDLALLDCIGYHLERLVNNQKVKSCPQWIGLVKE